MRRALVIGLSGLLCVALEGALCALFPTALVPDLGLLFVLAGAMLLGPAEALLLAAGLGLAADLLSGALLGQEAFLRVLEVAITRTVSAQIDLRRAFPLAVFAVGLSIFDALGMAILLRLFLGHLGLDWAALAPHLVRVLSNAVFAPIVAGLARAMAEGVDDQTRREVRLDTRAAR